MLRRASSSRRLSEEPGVPEIRLYCVTHKPLGLPVLDNLIPIQVGTAPSDFCRMRDNQGATIAEKNPSYSELTAIYSVWKNHPSDIVGFCHYRRYLFPPSLNSWLRSHAVRSYASGYIVKEEILFPKLSECGADYGEAFPPLLEHADVILPHPCPLAKGGMLAQYASIHPIGPMFRLLAILSDMDQRLGLLAHQFFLEHQSAHWCNLFITSWPVFNRYSQFLFEVLLRLENEVDLPTSQYQRRVFAFLSERLFNFWLWISKVKTVTVDWAMLDTSHLPREPHQFQANRRRRGSS